MGLLWYIKDQLPFKGSHLESINLLYGMNQLIVESNAILGTSSSRISFYYYERVKCDNEFRNSFHFPLKCYHQIIFSKHNLKYIIRQAMSKRYYITIQPILKWLKEQLNINTSIATIFLLVKIVTIKLTFFKLTIKSQNFNII